MLQYAQASLIVFTDGLCMSYSRSSGLLILGASGQIGQMWYRLWKQGTLDLGPNPLWQIRTPHTDMEQTLLWDILKDPAPDITPDAVICLAGVTSGADVALNAQLALAAVQVAQGAPVLFASTQAVYGPQHGCLSETDPCEPHTPYGRAKYAAEQAILQNPNVTILRFGNAIGADSLLRATKQGAVTLDRFPDRMGPRRMMIGPLTLGRACIDLLSCASLPDRILNLAQPELVAMADILEALGATWSWKMAPHTAISVLEMDLKAVQKLITLPPAQPCELIKEALTAGWQV